MGKNSRARRDAKKAKARANTHKFSGSGKTNAPPKFSGSEQNRPFFGNTESVSSVLIKGLKAKYGQDRKEIAKCVTKLANYSVAEVNRTVEQMMLTQVNAIWQEGWQPRELHRQGRIGCYSSDGMKLIYLAMATDYANRRATTLDSRWINQMENLELPIVNGKDGWVGSWSTNVKGDRVKVLNSILDALANVSHLPPLQPILPLPGTGANGPRETSKGPSTRKGNDSNPVLVKIRALLAQAESTTFVAEAETFTAKAQALMTRHAVDEAAVAAKSNIKQDQPVMIRLPVDAPYADTKALLLQNIAEATRCRTVFHSSVTLSTVLGFPNDIAGVELLYTSLLLQAQHALASETINAQPGSRVRGQSYKASFLLAYTTRIGDRLEEVNRSIYQEAEEENGSAFLPVLRDKDAAVNDFLQNEFGELKESQPRGGYDPAGWQKGHIAANLAKLNAGDLSR